MSESSKKHSALDAVWIALEAENTQRIEQLESRLEGAGQPGSKPATSLAQELSTQARKLEGLDREFAKTARRFERRFEAISMMDREPPRVEQLKAHYAASDLARQPDDFVLYRIIGNDLYPRHRKGQSRDNLRFILENENELEGCKKRWVVNRIADPAEEKAILELLAAHDQQWIHIPFSAEEYRQIPLDFDCLPSPGYLASAEFAKLGPEQRQRLLTALYRFKNNYVMNNNGARNSALEAGVTEAKWVLPWDGNCFLTPRAWKRIVEDVRERPWLAYYAVPMTRVLDNQRLVDDHFEPEAVEEPQLIFRQDAGERFNEAFCYGRRPKVELFWRLGIPGKWDRWKDDAWEQPRREPGSEAGQFGVAGWVARLYSGMGSLEKDNQASFKQRGLARQEAIVSTLQWLDRCERPETSDSERFGVIDRETLDDEARQYVAGDNGLLQRRVDHLLLEAEEALQRGPFSVIDKTTLPPSGDRQDYWHPAPYWWPNPDTSDGLPYIRRDGERVPGTRMYEPDSEKYDRTRVQRLFDDGLTLALAWRFTGDDRYADHAIRSLRTFFITPETRMNPHLQFAQVRLGHKKNQGMSTGIIEFKDFYFYLDAIRLLITSPALTHGDLEAFRAWLTDYLEWLLTSAQGMKECQAGNNHGTYYDLQVAAVSAFLQRQDVLYETLLRAQSRIACQIAPDGSQPEELTRTTTAHYCCYNLQGWMHLVELASKWGVDLWNATFQKGGSLSQAVQWLMSLTQIDWPFTQVDEFDRDRFYPIYFMARSRGFERCSNLEEERLAVKSLFYPHDGVMPYWNVTLAGRLSGHDRNDDNRKGRLDNDPQGAVRHYVFMRFGVGVFDENWLQHRLGLLEAVALPSLRKQKDVSFKLIVQVDRRLPSRYLEVVRAGISALPDAEIRYLDLHIDKSRDARDAVSKDKGEAGDIIIATRLDDDDALTENSLAQVQRVARELISAGVQRGAIAIRSGYRWLPVKEKAIPIEHPALGIGLSFVFRRHDWIDLFQNHMTVTERFHEKRGELVYLEREEARWLYTIHRLADTSVYGRIEELSRNATAVPTTPAFLQEFNIDEGSLKRWAELEDRYELIWGEKITVGLKRIERQILTLRQELSRQGVVSNEALEDLYQQRQELTSRLTRDIRLEEATPRTEIGKETF
ncbi:alginate lyase family protein [Salinicola halophilus]|uniref:alginate lyase family protein n=1 Tax=Salinicola halophilus TaxID=184065 RepID=UPI000DA253FB|nr:alginate lyase family protein [Salinicola halophilus]